MNCFCLKAVLTLCLILAIFEITNASEELQRNLHLAKRLWRNSPQNLERRESKYSEKRNENEPLSIKPANKNGTKELWRNWE
uniref:Venom protein n=1 Tax=Hemiscolopendra marginata TaxID=943146 RepID=A0A646QEL4_9MYRI